MSAVDIVDGGFEAPQSAGPTTIRVGAGGDLAAQLEAAAGALWDAMDGKFCQAIDYFAPRITVYATRWELRMTCGPTYANPMQPRVVGIVGCQPPDCDHTWHIAIGEHAGRMQGFAKEVDSAGTSMKLLYHASLCRGAPTAVRRILETIAQGKHDDILNYIQTLTSGTITMTI